MAKPTYTVCMNGSGNTEYTTYRVWLEGIVRSRTFKTFEEADSFYNEFNGLRLDVIVITVLKG